MMARWKRGWDWFAADRRWLTISAAPADSPKRVMLHESPPKSRMKWWTHSSALR
jgi:hypothetical protein